MVFNNLSEFNELHIMQDKNIDFYSIICLHRFGRGPALGGCRFIEYHSTQHAIEDAIRLSMAMSYKSAVSGLPHDGGKGVIIRPKKIYNRELFLKKFAEFVDSLGGKYITTVDSGTSQADMGFLKKYTSFVTGGLNPAKLHNNPSAATALGVFKSIECAFATLLNKELNTGHIVIQGVGNVGYQLAKLLYKKNVKLTVSDCNPLAASRCANEFNATIIDPGEVYGVKCDVFSPCGFGQIINYNTLNIFNTKIIAGAANDQLVEENLDKKLQQRGIIYLPDFVINAGGLIHLSLQLQGKNSQCIKQEVMKIAERVACLIRMAQLKNITVYEIACSLAHQELARKKTDTE